MRNATIAVTGALLLALTGCSKSETGAPTPGVSTGVTSAPPPSSPPPSSPAASTPAPYGSANPAASTAPLPGGGIQLPPGTMLEVRVDQTLSTARNREGDKFGATLERPVDLNGREVLPRGTRLMGHVSTSRPSGRLKGRAVIGIRLDSFEYRGQAVPIVTTLDTRSSKSHKTRNLELIGGGAGVGALIGGLVGGGRGAAIGAGAGAGAGTGTAALTGRKNVEIPAETVFTFRLKAPAELR